LSATIAPASRQDLPEILEIYNEVIRTSTAVYTEIEFTAERGAAWFDAKRAAGFPLALPGLALLAIFARRLAISAAWSTAFMFAPTAAVGALADSW
jgi:hypothetical protein